MNRTENVVRRRSAAAVAPFVGLAAMAVLGAWYGRVDGQGWAVAALVVAVLGAMTAVLLGTSVEVVGDRLFYRRPIRPWALDFGEVERIDVSKGYHDTVLAIHVGRTIRRLPITNFRDSRGLASDLLRNVDHDVLTDSAAVLLIGLQDGLSVGEIVRRKARL